MNRQRRTLREILQVKLGDSLNTVVAVNIERKEKLQGPVTLVKKYIYNAFPHSFFKEILNGQD